jgi:hypothetical protein
VRLHGVCECDPIYVVFILQSAFEKKPAPGGCYDEFWRVFASSDKAHNLADFSDIVAAEDFSQLI